ncbi:MAG: formyltetrahydrofolate deformylase [Verrucomicrobia bacterium]|nr:formyltetrahydrofolate deformylase [Verrucomicrobiota bacterium]
MKQFANITVIGRDRTGVIARVTNFLFEQGANIEALDEQVTRGQFSMALQASWKAKDWRPNQVRAGLDALARTLDMEIRLRYAEPSRLQRCAIMVTREPHCLKMLLSAFAADQLKAEPVLVVGNRRELEPLAREHRLRFLYVPWNDRTKAETRVLREFDAQHIDFVVLARFMKILSPNFVWRFKNKIINIHPSLLPSFPGPQAYRQAYEHGVKIVGVTAHFVSMHLDEGPIIAQGCFEVSPSMTLKDLVAAGQKLEAKVLLKAVKLYLAKRLDVYWGIVKQV